MSNGCDLEAGNPGQNFRIDVPGPGGTKGILGFADYATPGDHRVELKTSGSQIVNMGQDGIQALPTAAFANSNEPPPKSRMFVRTT